MNSDKIKNYLIDWLEKQATRQKGFGIEITLGKLIKDHEELAIYCYYTFLILNSIPIDNWPTIKQLTYLDKLLNENKKTMTILKIEWLDNKDWITHTLLTKADIGTELKLI